MVGWMAMLDSRTWAFDRSWSSEADLSRQCQARSSVYRCQEDATGQGVRLDRRRVSCPPRDVLIALGIALIACASRTSCGWRAPDTGPDCWSNCLHQHFTSHPESSAIISHLLSYIDARWSFKS